MALSNIFASLTSAVLSQLDTNFNQVGAMGVTACSLDATSTANAIVLDVNANQTDVSAYNNYQLFSFVAGATPNGSVTIQVGNLAALNFYLQDGITQVGSGNLAANIAYLIVFNSSLNSGIGGFQMVSQMPVSSLLDLISSTQGSILTRGALSWGSLAPGAAGTFLVSQGPGNALAFGSVAGSTTTINALAFSSSGSFSFSSNSGITASMVFKLTMVGGGGGGGGASSSTAISGGGGGGGGGILIAYVSGLSANTFYSGAIGSGGAPGNGGAGVTNGSAGGVTTISFGGVQFTAGGGGPGWQNGIASGGSGGVAANGTILITGSPGFTGGLVGGTPVGGAGGDGIWGGGGQAVYGAQRGMNGLSPGAGGSGAAQASGSGGSGAAGIFMMEWVQ